MPRHRDHEAPASVPVDQEQALDIGEFGQLLGRASDRPPKDVVSCTGERLEYEAIERLQRGDRAIAAKIITRSPRVTRSSTSPGLRLSSLIVTIGGATGLFAAPLSINRPYRAAATDLRPPADPRPDPSSSFLVHTPFRRLCFFQKIF